MRQFNPKMGIPMSAAQYAEQWGANSSHFREQGYYDWMCSQVAGVRRVLEVGCGTGFSTAALLASGVEKVFVIESNQHLVTSAVEYLRKNGFSVQVRGLEDARVGLQESQERVHIVRANLFSADLPEFASALAVDGIVCWLIGADPSTIADSMQKEVCHLQKEDMAAYREQVHSRCYSLARNALDANGVIHFVDRGGLPDLELMEDAKEQIVQDHLELSVGAFAPTKVEVKLLDKSYETSKLQYVAQVQGVGVHLCLNSIVAKKITTR